MAPKYKLTYFDFSGLGETIRFLLHYGGIEFIDNRILQKDWPEFKPKTPFGQMPLLEFDGRVLHQSTAIGRYLAKQVGLVGSNDLEDWEIDAAVESVNDVRLSVAKFRYDPDPERKKSTKEWLEKERLPFLLARLDNWAKENNGYLANKKLSWADLYFTAVIGYLGYFMERDLLPDYPNLQTVTQNVLSIPGIKDWVDKRPADYI